MKLKKYKQDKDSIFLVLYQIESKYQVERHTDFTKAFDRGRYSILITKLNKMGAHSSLLDWVRPM